jgi:hypothetical protein
MTNWMQNAFSQHPGALHKQLGYGKHDILPPGLVHELATANTGTHVRGYTVTPLLKRRSIAADNARR